MKTLAEMLRAKSYQSPTRLMGFREWCQKVWEPSKRFRLQRALLELKKRDKLVPNLISTGALNGGEEMEGRRGSSPPFPIGRTISSVV